MQRLAAPRVRVSWIDPRTGEGTVAGLFDNTGVGSFATPRGFEDALLVLERAEA
jgi:hypothetical protein